MRNQVVSHEERLEARLQLLAAEREFMRQRDALTRRRMAQPWERQEKPYRFEGQNGVLSLADLLEGRSWLIVDHFMLAPDGKDGCKACSLRAENFKGIPIHLNHRDATLTAVSRAPFAKIASGFNFDYHVSFTPEQIIEGKACYKWNGYGGTINIERRISIEALVRIEALEDRERHRNDLQYECVKRP